jgi:radical SAM-linked protein
LNVSISTFVPKSHTPFMWSPQIPLKESQRRIRIIQNGLKGSPVRVKWNDPELSWLEGIFSRGDRRLGKAVVEAWKLGAKFDAWGEHFRREIWEEAFRRTGIDPNPYLYRQRSLDEVLPWDHIKSGVTKAYLQREWTRAQVGTPTPDCRDACLDCGVCDHKEVSPVLFEDWEFPEFATPPASKTVSSSPRRFRLDFEKRDQAKYLGHLELVRVFVRAFRRAGFELVYSRGYHPMPKLSFACALPVGTESLHETLEVELRGTPGPSDIIDGINHQLPRGIQVNSAEEIVPGKKKGKLRESHFVLTVKGSELREKDVNRFLETDHFPVLKTNKNGGAEVDARSLVKSMRLISSKSVELIFQHTTGPELKPVEILKSVFDLQGAPLEGLRVLKIKQVVS